MLARETAARGAQIWNAHAFDAEERAGCWHVGTTTGTLRASLLINAVGRQAHFTFRSSGRRHVCDHTVAMGQLFDDSTKSPWIVIEASPAGWAYSAPVPGGRQVVMFFTDPDILRSTSWRQLLAALPHTSKRLEGTVVRGPLFRRSANAWCRSRIAGDTWLCVGDAAATVDPLSGQGVARALMDGITAGRTCLAMLAGDRRAGESFQSEVVRRFAEDCQTRLTYYRAEARWSDAPFWHRRHAPEPVDLDPAPNSF